MDLPAVSVIIPTTGRDSVNRAVHSALAQIDIEVEVIVVVNKTEALPRFSDPRVRVIDARHTPGQGPARQLGVTSATNGIVALLDDDDYWEADKCIGQIRDVRKFVPASDENWLASTGLVIHHPDGSSALRPRQNSVPTLVEDPASYLFVRRSLKRVDNFIQSSSLMFPRTLALQIPFEGLPEVCTDWGWVIAAHSKAGCKVVVASGHRTHYDISVPGISRSNRTIQILDWADRILADKPARVIGDFYATTPLQVTAHFGDVSGAVRVLKHAYTKGRPGLPASLMAARNLVRCGSNYLRRALRLD